MGKLFTHCIYHANCQDGFAAAMVVYQYCFLHNQPPLVLMACQYGDPLPDIPNGSSVIIVDFSFPREVLDALEARCDLVVIDHHKTAQEALSGASYAIFDMEKSGCRLTFGYLFPDWDVPFGLLCIEDRDLWRFRLIETEQYCAGLQTIPKTMPVWVEYVFSFPGCHREIMQPGKTLLDYNKQRAKTQAAKATLVNWEGHVVACANLTNLISETQHEMLELFPEASFTMSYFDLPGKRVFSLRSKGDFDVSAVAKPYGGGGHKNAAGFSIETNPYNWPLETTYFDHL